MQKTELKFNSQICTTKEQSQRLLELGLKPETADMCWFNDMQKPFCAPYKCFVDRAQDMKWVIYPAWSLHRLMEILDAPLVEFDFLSYNPYEEIIYNISECIKNGYINKEYLKQ